MSISYLKTLTKRGLHALGYDIHRHTTKTNSFYQILKGLEKFDIDLVLDIGANTGQFASELRSIGYQGEILSFEPLSDAYEALRSAAARDVKWRVHERGAVGHIDGETEINVAGNSVSSSVLPMMDYHSSAASGSAYIRSEMVPIFRLDSIAQECLKKSHRPFLKVDTQGFEWQVLDGATKIMPHLRGVLCELSLVSLYEGQHLWLEIIERLEGEGFTLWCVQKGFTDPRDGRALQLDAVFFRL